MTGTIVRLVDSEQSGTIAGEDGVQYTFSANAVRGVTFKQLSLGTQVTFTRAQDVEDATGRVGPYWLLIPRGATHAAQSRVDDSITGRFVTSELI